MTSLLPMAPSKPRSVASRFAIPPRAGADGEGRPSAIAPLLNQRGLVVLDRVAAKFGLPKAQLAEMIGLKREALYKLARVEAARPQARLRDMLECVSRLSEWAGGDGQALAWYRAQPIAACGGRTAETLVREGEAGSLRSYLDHIALGGFA
jgi:hypothetical protein